MRWLCNVYITLSEEHRLLNLLFQQWKVIYDRTSSMAAHATGAMVWTVNLFMPGRARLLGTPYHLIVLCAPIDTRRTQWVMHGLAGDYLWHKRRTLHGSLFLREYIREYRFDRRCLIKMKRLLSCISVGCHRQRPGFGIHLHSVALVYAIHAQMSSLDIDRGFNGSLKNKWSSYVSEMSEIRVNKRNFWLRNKLWNLRK